MNNSNISSKRTVTGWLDLTRLPTEFFCAFLSTQKTRAAVFFTLPDPWYCFWCYHLCDPKPPLPLESYRVRVNRTIVSDSSVSEFMKLLLYLNGDIDDSAWYDKEIDFSLPLTTGVDDNGLGWSPPSLFPH